MVAQCVRFWPEYVYVKQVLDDQRFGRLKAVHLRRQASTPIYSMDNWLMDEKLAGGMILDMHIHDVDYALYALGKPKSIQLQGVLNPARGVDRVYAQWNYEKGLPVLLEGYWDMPPGFGFNMGFSLLFEEAAVEYDFNTGQPLKVFRNDGDPENPDTPELLGDDGYFREIEYMLDCIEKDQEPAISTPQQSRDAVAIALAETEGVYKGELVRLS
jgi:predicted dehydrogenase